jgi:hypothetical protein
MFGFAAIRILEIIRNFPNSYAAIRKKKLTQFLRCDFVILVSLKFPEHKNSLFLKACFDRTNIFHPFLCFSNRFLGTSK